MILVDDLTRRTISADTCVRARLQGDKTGPPLSSAFSAMKATAVNKSWGNINTGHVFR